jgi:hypothetical protein
MDLIRGKYEHSRLYKAGCHIEFQLLYLEGLLQRSETNNARIQNEITLVGLQLVTHTRFSNLR